MHYLKSLLSVALCYFLALGSTACRTTTSVSETKEVDPEEWLKEVPNYDVKSRKIVADFANSFMTTYLEDTKNLVLFDKRSKTLSPMTIADAKLLRKVPEGKEVFIGSVKSRYFLSLKPSRDFYERLRKNELKMIVYQHDREKSFETVDYTVLNINLADANNDKSIAKLTGETFRKINSTMLNVKLEELRAQQNSKIDSLKDEIARRTAADAKETERIVKDAEKQAAPYVSIFNANPLMQISGTVFFLVASSVILFLSETVLKLTGVSYLAAHRILIPIFWIAVAAWAVFMAYDTYAGNKYFKAMRPARDREDGVYSEARQIKALKQQLDELVSEQGMFFVK